ncbi:MAG TPA: xanthine dehydrogenase [Methylocystis sp.]|nr:xanthine dehydrogenase [Methylocystis sp.]
MHGSTVRDASRNVRRGFAIILGTNEIASAVAVRLLQEGYNAALSYDPHPPALRRGMSFHDALFDDSARVDGIIGRRAENAVELFDVFASRGCVAVTPLHATDLIPLRRADAIIDARMQKERVTPDLRGLAGLAVGIGPVFTVGKNCDVAVETHPARAGALLKTGRTWACDGIPRALGGLGEERFLRAPSAGVWRTPLNIGDRVYKGVTIGLQEGAHLLAPMDGFLRGLTRDGAQAPEGAKLVEIDPRGRRACWTGTDELGRAVAEATTQAVLAARIGARRATLSAALMH